MARVTLPAGIASISGRVGNVCFRTMKATGKVFMSSLPEVRKSRPSAEELASRERFRKKAQLVSMMRKAGSRLSNKQLWELASKAI